MMLSSWQGWRDVHYLEFTSTKSFDLIAETGSNAHLIALYNRQSADTVTLNVGIQEIFRIASTAFATEVFPRPIPVMFYNGSTSLPLHYTALDVSGSAEFRIYYILDDNPNTVVRTGS